MDETKSVTGEETEASVSEAIANLDKVVGLLEAWDRQPGLLAEVKALKNKLERLLVTVKNRPRPQSGGVP
jgi:ribosome-associated translation inhibitor RaiA